MIIPFRVFRIFLLGLAAFLLAVASLHAGWTPENLIFAPGGYFYSMPLEAGGNNVHIAFFGHGPGLMGEVGYLRSSDRGDTWSSPHYYVPYSSGHTGSYPIFQIWQNKILVTWRDYGGQYHDFNVGYSISYNNGLDWTAPDYILDPGLEGITRLSTCNFENDIHVIFHQSDGYIATIYYIKSSNFGQSWSEKDWLFTFDTAEKGDIVAFGDYIHYFFGGRQQDTSTMELYYLRSTNSGLTWEDPVIISHDDGYSSRWPRAAINDLGYVAVLWKDLRRVNNEVMYGYYLTVSTDNGSSWREPIYAVRITDFDDEKEIIWDQNTLHIVWQDKSDFWIPYDRILYSFSSDFGQSWEIPDTVDSNYLYDSKNPSIAASDGHLYTVWMDDNYIVEESGMYFSRYEDETVIFDNSIPNQNQFKLNTYPNPFNSNLVISYSNLSSNRFEIFNIIGQKVMSFDLNGQASGEIIWNGRDFDDKQVSSGLYFLRAATADTTLSRMVLLLK